MLSGRTKGDRSAKCYASEMEGFRKPEKKKLGTAEIGAMLITLFSALDAVPAQALEIMPGTSWQNGVDQNVRSSALKGKVEQGAVYVQFADNSGTWLSTSDGEAQKLNMNIREVQRQAHSTGKTISDICILHTHPAEINRVHIKIPGVTPETVPIPPSRGDIEIAQSKQLSAGTDNLTFGAADSLGVWYFSGKNMGDKPQSSSEDNSQKFYAHYKDFVVKSTDRGFSFHAELPKLQQAYRQYLNGDVRFVSYEQIKNEPPCAGTNYSMKNQTQENRAATEKVSVQEHSAQNGEGVVRMDMTQAVKTFRPPQ